MGKTKTKRQKSLAEGIRNQSYYLFQKNISKEDEKILMVLKLEKCASAWTIANLSGGIFITNVRRSITNMKHAGNIKECGSEISKVTGVKNTLYTLSETTDEEIEKWKKEKKIKDEKEAEEQAELNNLKFEALKKMAEYDNKMMTNYTTK